LSTAVDAHVSVPADRAQTSSRPTVLVVDDDALTRLVVAGYARSAGLDPVCAENGREAIDLISGGVTPALVVTDLDMPELDGAALIRHIRTDRRLRRVPIILRSGSERPPGNADADLWLGKASPDALVIALHEFAASRV
jgi:CheY-like chemotaxis protein